MRRKINAALVKQKTPEKIKTESEYYNIEITLSLHACIVEITPKSIKSHIESSAVMVDEFDPEEYL